MEPPDPPQPPAPVSPAVQALERLLARRRQLVSGLVSLDGYERWGARTPEDHARASAEAGELDREKGQVEGELTALVERLRVQEPESVQRWAAGWRELLIEFLNRVAPGTTEAFVAGTELEEWNKVARGEVDFVDQNTFYVQYDRALHARVFGLT